jgi:FkbM family methyltransferase
MVSRILRKIRKLFFPKPVIITEYNTYSQAGEDAVLSFLFADKKISNVSYLDIGTNSPDGCNNTYLLYMKGNRGVCVEADKTLIPIIEKVRPNDKVINAGVAVSDESEADFYVFNNSGLNTFNRDEALRREAHGTYKIMQVVKVPLIKIDQIIKENFVDFPDFLSIDIEGLDLEVLKSLDFGQFPIPVICAETCAYSENHIRPKDKTISEFLFSKGYDIYADTYINTIFVNNAWFYNTK